MRIYVFVFVFMCVFFIVITGASVQWIVRVMSFRKCRYGKRFPLLGQYPSGPTNIVLGNSGWFWSLPPRILRGIVPQILMINVEKLAAKLYIVTARGQMHRHTARCIVSRKIDCHCHKYTNTQIHKYIDTTCGIVCRKESEFIEEKSKIRDWTAAHHFFFYFCDFKLFFTLSILWL